jgi:transcriptional repressor NrdR
MAKISELAEAVERELAETGVKELTTQEIGERILPRLRELDEVSYVRYASIYRDFRDIDEFVSELSDVIKARTR